MEWERGELGKGEIYSTTLEEGHTPLPSMYIIPQTHPMKPECHPLQAIYHVMSHDNHMNVNDW